MLRFEKSVWFFLIFKIRGGLVKKLVLSPLGPMD